MVGLTGNKMTFGNNLENASFLPHCNGKWRKTQARAIFLLMKSSFIQYSANNRSSV